VQEAEPEPEPVPEVQEQEPEPEPVPEVQEAEPEPEPVPEPEIPEQEIPEQEEEPEPMLIGVPENIVTLDDHLDYAYTEKEAGHVAAAAAAYQQALERFADDPYVPFLVIELGNLYKEAGAYDVAAKTYRDALTLPTIQGQTDIVAEFRKNISYLDAVSHITARHDAPEIPFSQIPPDWIAEIEAEFAKQTGN
jgi:colicin import membrane protein